MDILYIIIPAYNEEENIEQVIEDWYPIIQKHDGGGASRLVIIDDGSKDKTFSIIQQAAISKPLLCPITKPNGSAPTTITSSCAACPTAFA